MVFASVSVAFLPADTHMAPNSDDATRTWAVLNQRVRSGEESLHENGQYGERMVSVW